MCKTYIMKIQKLTSLTVFFILFIVTSCTMEKRLYMPGYYVNANSKKNINDKTIDKIVNNLTTKNNELFYLNDDCVFIPINQNSGYSKMSCNKYRSFISLPLFDTIPNSKNETYNEIKKEDDCSEIIMRSGDIFKGVIIEVGVSEIKYKKCDFLTGPTYVFKKSDVLLIKYANGNKDVFQTEQPVKQETQPIKQVEVINTYPARDTRKVETGSIISFVTGLVGGLTPFFGLAVIFSIVAIITGIGSLSRIDKANSIYKGRGYAITGLVVGLVSILVLLYLSFK